MSTPLLCTTQDEVNAALARGVQDLIVDATDGAWLEIRHDGLVRLWESSRVVAWGSSSVEAWESSSVEARESSSVVARGSSSVVARESSSVEAWGSSRVEAWESSRVEAWESSRVEAGRWVAVHLWSQRVTLTGDGHVIDMTALDLSDPEVWCAYHGIHVDDGRALLYKAVDSDLRTTSHIPTTYTIGQEVAATDWQATAQCGHGLHFSPSPSQARSCAVSIVERYVAVSAAVADLIPLGDDKCKAPACVVLHEVDQWGDQIKGAK